MSAAMKALRRNQSSTFGLQITSMIDMFTIILVFLLKSYSSSAVDATPSQNLRLPSSTSVEKPVEALKMMVSQTGIFVDDKLIVTLENGVPAKSSISLKDEKFIQPLFDSLTAEAQKTKSISKQNDSVAFDGRIIFQADQKLSYQVIRKVMYTASLAGYSDFKFAVVGQ